MDEVEGGSSVVEPECPVPIVKLKSDILETESLNLLTEATYVDTLLTALPVGYFPRLRAFLSIALPFLIFSWCVLQVLSEEQQHALAATPAHPAGLHGGMFLNLANSNYSMVGFENVVIVLYRESCIELS